MHEIRIFYLAIDFPHYIKNDFWGFSALTINFRVSHDLAIFNEYVSPTNEQF